MHRQSPRPCRKHKDDLNAAPDRSRIPSSARPTHVAAPAGLRGTTVAAPSRFVPHTLGAPAYHIQTTSTPRKPGPALCGSIPRTRRAGPTHLQGRPKRRQCHLSAGTAERKFAHRASQSHAQTRTGTEHTPSTPNHSVPHAQRRQETARTRRPARRQASCPPDLAGSGRCYQYTIPADARPTTDAPARRPPTTGRPCASPSPSLRSTSASAWAALSTRTTKRRLPHRPSPIVRHQHPHLQASD